MHHTVYRLGQLCLILLLASAGQAQTLATTRQAVPLEQQQPEGSSLESLLDELNRAHDVSFLYERRVVRGKSAQVDLRDHATVESVLRAVLPALQLSYERIDATTYVIVPDRSGALAPLLNLPADIPEVTPERVALTVSGRVTDETNFGLPGVNILEKGTLNGTVTDLDGNYTVEVQEGATLVYSAIGFVTQEIEVGNRATIDVMLIEDVKALEEVVVIGYGTTSRKELTGAVSVVEGEDIEALNPTRAEQALQGQTPGVQISSASGSPGGAFNIRIRGVTTNGDNSPLILVDGVRYPDLGSLNPANIESVNILKDASAAIYGVQGANGVILITTKTGKQGAKPTLTFNTYYGVQETTRRLPVLNATEYAAIVNEAHVNGGELPPFTNIGDLGEGTDWQDEVFNRAPIQDHNLTLRGGGDRSTYAISAGYFAQEGIVGREKANFERYAANLNTTYDVVEDLKFTAIANYTHSVRNTLLENALGSVLFNALNMAPTLTPRDENGAFTLAEGLGGEVINPLAQIENSFNPTYLDQLNGNTSLSYNILDGLSVTSILGFNYLNFRNKFFAPISFYGTGKVFNIERSFVTERQGISKQLTWDNVVDYNLTVADEHDFKFTVGSSVFRDRYEELSVTGLDIPNNSFEFADISQAQEFDAATAGGSIQADYRLLSYFGRVQYDYRDKYLLSVILRRDGTTRFGPNNRFGYFPTVTAGWIISDEPFLANAGALGSLKLRASYGLTGNDKIGEFRYISSLNGEAEYAIGGNNLTQGLAIGPLSNPDIRWETNEQFNVGADVDFWNGRLAMTADYFIKTTRDLLLAVPVSGLAGINAPGSAPPFANAGSIRNQGVEFQVDWNQPLGEEFTMRFTYNFTYLNNNTLNLSDGVSFIQGGQFGIGQLPPNRWEVGQPIGYFFGLETDGLFQTPEDVATSAQPNAQPGDLRYVDQNADGVINQDDRTRIGNPIPDYVMGLNIGLNYKGFDFSIFGDAQLGHDIVRNYERNLPLTNRTAYYLDRWTGPGSTNDFPRVSTGANDNDLFSDFWVEDGSYARIKNIQLGYTLPNTLSERFGASRLRVYTAVNNLYTFTNYQGYEPNVSAGSPLAAGLDIGYYPQARSYMFGANLTF